MVSTKEHFLQRSEADFSNASSILPTIGPTIVPTPTSYKFAGEHLAFCSLLSTAILLPFRDEHEAVRESVRSILAQKDALLDLYLIECGESATFQGEYSSPRVHYIPFLSEGRTAKVPLFGPVNKVLPTIRSDYIIVFTPGTRFLSPQSLAYCHEYLLSKSLPDLLYTPCWMKRAQAGWDTNPELVLRTERLNKLYQGLLPTAPECIWIKRILFQQKGYFSSHVEYDGVFDFICRLPQKKMKVATCHRVFIEQNKPKKRLGDLFNSVKERLRLVYVHFGLKSWILALFKSGKATDFIKSVLGSPRFRGPR